MDSTANPLCIRELTEIVGGRLMLGSMPPLGGEQEPLGRLVSDDQLVRGGDVVFVGAGTSCVADLLYAQGALGVVVGGRHVEPWAGRFSLRVDDVPRALGRLATWARRQFTGTVVAVIEPHANGRITTLIDRVLATQHPGLILTRFEAGRVDGLLDIVRLTAGHRYALVPLPATSRRELDPLVQSCCPHVAVLCATAVPRGKARAALGPLRAVVDALPEGGWVVLDRRDERLRREAESTGARITTIGNGNEKDSDVVISDVARDADHVTFRINGYPVLLCGRRQARVVAAACAFAVGRIMEIPEQTIVRALNEPVSLEG
jgi:UDP-N-acetylmuramyl pentapeptide synthase